MNANNNKFSLSPVKLALLLWCAVVTLSTIFGMILGHRFDLWTLLFPTSLLVTMVVMFKDNKILKIIFAIALTAYIFISSLISLINAGAYLRWTYKYFFQELIRFLFKTALCGFLVFYVFKPSKQLLPLAFLIACGFSLLSTIVISIIQGAFFLEALHITFALAFLCLMMEDSPEPPARAVRTVAAPQPKPDPVAVARMEALNKLAQMNLISREEYLQKKQEIISQMH